MTAQSIFNNDAKVDLTDIVFKYRNKAYGAYELRKHYNERVNKSMLITLTVFTLFFLTIWIIISSHTIPIIKPIIYTTAPVPNLPKASPQRPHKPNSQPLQSKAQSNPDNRNFKVVKNFIPTFKPDSIIDIPKGGNTLQSANKGNTKVDTSGQLSGGTPTLTDDKKILDFAEVMPEFPGGYNAMQKYLKDNIHYTNAAYYARAEGKIYIKFVVNADGTIENVRIEKDKMGYDCAQDAISVIKNMPLWKPGSNGGHPVRVEMGVPIEYQLQQE